MKRFLLTFSVITMMLGVALSSYGNLNGNGFYRVRNYGTNRWATLVDNKGAIDMSANTADLHSLQLVSDTETILSSPGSVVYISSLGNSEYNVAAQGTSVQSLLGYSVFLRADGTSNGENLYRIYGKYQGYTKYIGDGEPISSKEYGKATINITNTNADMAKWLVLPIDNSGTNFFGPVPTLTIDGKMYNPLFTSFAYTPISSGTKAYYIGRTGFGMAEMIEIKGAVPAGTPVIFECAGRKAADNKVRLETVETAIPNNSLRGVYFNYSSSSQSNQTRYNPKTMRMLGKCSDGSLGFITANIEFIPANTSYLVVPEGSSPELKCVTTAEYEANLPKAPDQIYVIGSMNSWDANDATYNLLPQDDYTYSGTFRFDPPILAGSNLYFRFFTALGDLNKNSLGAYGTTNAVVAASNTTTYSGNFTTGGLWNWEVPGWEGGEVTISLNILTQTVNLSFDLTKTEPDPETAPEQIYVIGSMNGWNPNSNSLVLLPQADNIYTGSFEIDATDGQDVSFRFFTELGNLNEHSLGAAGGSNVNIYHSEIIPFTDLFSIGSTHNWVLQDWPGGTVTVSLNFANKSVKFTFEYADIDPDPDQPTKPEKIYIVGSINGWNANDGSYVLLPQDDDTYFGTFEIEQPAPGAGNVAFRFFTKLGNLYDNSLGCWGNTDVTVNYSNTTPFIGMFTNGSLGNWILSNWPGGSMSVSLDLSELSVKFSFVYSGIEEVEVNSDAISFSNGVITSGNATDIRVFNMSGQTVAAGYGERLDISDLAPGIYVVAAGGKTIKIKK